LEEEEEKLMVNNNVVSNDENLENEINDVLPNKIK
jgi:hypothetical protein